MPVPILPPRMYTVRDVLAVVLAAAIGIVLLVTPAAVLRLQFFAHGPTTGRHGEYGEDREFEPLHRWLARAVGAVALGAAAAILLVPHL